MYIWNWTAVLLLLISLSISEGSWGTPDSSQYHIQTDEGPERYFRYQTDNGQYRKEKRLKDGTVIGTDAWIDANGVLRQKDYIADQQGYRILKSKTMFVGKGRPIAEAIKALSKIPAQAGEFIRSGLNNLTRIRPNIFQSNPITTTTQLPLLFDAPLTTTTPLPIAYDYVDPPSPSVFIRPHSQPIDNTYIPALNGPTTTAETFPTLGGGGPVILPSTSILGPPLRNDIRPIAIYPSSTPGPISGDYGPPLVRYPVSSTPLPPIASSTPFPPIGSTTPDYLSVIPSTAPGLDQSSPYNFGAYPSSTVSPLSVNPLNNELLPPRFPFSPSSTVRPLIASSARPFSPSSTERPAIHPVSNDLDIQPIFSRNPAAPIVARPAYNQYYGKPQPTIYNNNLGSGYDQQYPLYDGVSVNNNGFRYYLPRQYHEENNIDAERRVGSFGYIDPFGIRRVVYYNTGPGQGFVHRKNNRYVGFNATPYDPRPL